MASHGTFFSRTLLVSVLLIGALVLPASSIDWVSSGTPDCDDTLGQHLNIDRSGAPSPNTWSCGTSLPPPTVNVMADGTTITPLGVSATSQQVLNTQINSQGVGTLTWAAPSGTPLNGGRIMVRLKCTNPQTFSFNAIYRGSTDLTLASASCTGSSKTDYFGFIYNAADVRWDFIAMIRGF